MDLNTLLQSAQNLTKGSNDSQLPGVERTLQQVLQATEEFHRRVTQTGTKEIQAQILLGCKGIDLPKLNQKLEALNATKTFEPLEVAGADTDVCTFLRNERENAIMSVTEDTNKNINDSVSKQKWTNLISSWNHEKTRLLDALIGPSQNFIDLQRLPEQKILNPDCLLPSCLDKIGLVYAQELSHYNALVLKGEPRPNLVQKFAELSNNFMDARLTDMWILLANVTQVSETVRQGDPIKNRQHPEFVLNAKRFLERRYKVYVNSRVNVVEKDSDTYQLVRAYVKCCFTGTHLIGLVDTVGGQPLWPLIYYSLRCGAVDTAVKFLHEAGTNYEDFVQIISDRKAGIFNSKIESQLKLQYANKIRNSTDAYKKVVYCILLGCDANEVHGEVSKTIDDFIWIKLSMLHPNDSTGYGKLQSLIIDSYGEKYFDASQKPHIYFQVLALTGQFEAAIEYLSRSDLNLVHSVHMGIALQELGLLIGVRSVTQPLLSIDICDPIPLRRLNYARLIRLYVHRFEATDTAEALHYYYTLRNLYDPKGRNMFLTCVCNLVVDSGVLNTSIFDLIFGRRREEGANKNELSGSLFGQFSCEDFDTQTIADLVAGELAARGNFEMAVRLYDIAGNLNLALKYTCILLAQVVQQPQAESPLRARLSLELTRFSTRLSDCSTEIEPKVHVSFILLRDLFKFFDLYYEGKLEAALEQLERIPNIIPSSNDDLDLCLANVKQLSGDVIKVIPDVMVAAMNLIVTKYKQLQPLMNDASTEKQRVHEMRQRAKAISNMSVALHCSVTNQRLLKLELQMQ